MLPEAYCDYLLALYTNGEDINESVPVKSSNQWTQAVGIHFILTVTMIPFSFLVVYFTEFNSLLQLGILSFFWIYSVWVFLYCRKREIHFHHFPLYISLLLLLLLTTTGSIVLTASTIIQSGTILSNFILWLFISIDKKHGILKTVSILCILFTSFYIILKYLTS